MATDSLLDRINKVDFFAVLPPGFYSVLLLGFLLKFPQNATTMIEALSPIAFVLKENPVYLIFLLFAAYLFGSIIRALKVKWAEKVSPPFRSDFPYQDELKIALETLKKSQAIKVDTTKFPDLSGGVSEDVFNYWKDVLCAKSDKAFDYYESFETRARFSAGMVWAGVVGMIASLSMLFRCVTVGWQLLVLSLVVYIAFGFHLRRVRKQEAKALLFLYVAHLQT